MKISKINKYSAAGLMMAAAIAVSSCSDSFLDVSDPTRTTIDEYFTTDARIQEAVVAAYDPPALA